MLDAVRRRARRWMYRGGHPHGLGRLLNRIDEQFASWRVGPQRLVTLEVPGRHSGRLISLPVVLADVDGERYLVAMLGNDAHWVRNVRAANGLAVLRRGEREAVRLDEVPVARRAPILKRYLALAPGARAHVPVDPRAPVEEFAAVADRYPVFHVVPALSAPADAPSASGTTSAG
jgi:hypothetical protein